MLIITCINEIRWRRSLDIQGYESSLYRNAGIANPVSTYMYEDTIEDKIDPENPEPWH